MNSAVRFLAATGALAATVVGGVVQGVRMATLRFVTRSGWIIDWSFGRTRIDYARWVDPMRNSIVVAVVRWVARNFPESPVRIRRLNPDGTYQNIPPAETGPGAMLTLLERPNPYFSGVLQWIATIIDLFVTGNGYWIKLRDRNPDSVYFDRPAELWYVPKKFMRPAWPLDGSVFISHYLYRIDGVDYRVEARDVIHFRDGINPDNMREGMSSLGAILREIYTDDEAGNFSAQVLTNFGVPGVIIAPSNTTGGRQVTVDPETIKTKYKDTFGGDGRGEPMVLSAAADIKVLSWSPEQMDLKGLRRLPEERISAVLGVPAGVAQLGAGLDRNTFTNYSEARRAAFQEAIAPLMRLIAAELEVQLLDDFADLTGLDVDFDTSKASALQEAVDSIWRRTESAATKGLLTRAAFKRAIGEPVDDVLDDVYIVPNNYTFMPPGGRPPIGGRPSALAPVEPAANADNGNGHHDLIGAAA